MCSRRWHFHRRRVPASPARMRPYGVLLLSALSCVAAAAEGLQGKVMCGYQGWFRTPSDGNNNGWHHYANGKTLEPGTCSIELWPDIRELPAANRVPTPFRHPDGSAAEVYNSTDQPAIDLHFQWMREYGIDGVFLQRFATTTRDPRFRGPMDKVLVGVRTAAQSTARQWALMYDLTGLKPGQMDTVIDDWKKLRQEMAVADTKKDAAYLTHRGKPIVALWGLGFNDREPMLEEWQKLIAFLKDDPQYGGCSIMLGLPTFWRTLSRDAIKDPKLHEIIATADVVSPWTVGRYNAPKGAEAYAKETVVADIAWCTKKELDYLPVAFPGFSWHNLSARRGKEAPLNAIPRVGGQFLWSQVRAFRDAEAHMLYIAMFDELDEGTAIYKVRQDPPSTAESPFLAEPEVPSDHYLWLTGEAGRVFRGEYKPSETLPFRAPKVPKTFK
jgi:hypothetical protein